MLELVRPEAVLPDRALCLPPTASHLVISLCLSLSPPHPPPPLSLSLSVILRPQRIQDWECGRARVDLKRNEYHALFIIYIELRRPRLFTFELRRQFGPTP
jgi:hypothetical protein